MKQTNKGDRLDPVGPIHIRGVESSSTMTRQTLKQAVSYNLNASMSSRVDYSRSNGDNNNNSELMKYKKQLNTFK